MKHTLTLLILTILVVAGFSQNVGLGNSNPGFPLDLTGRMRIRQGTVSAGIYFDGPLSAQRSFVGSMNNDYFGVWGAGSSWGIVMNVNNGNVGIGNIAPTASLDVDGSFRFRGESPKLGSTLTSVDVNGNAVWAQPVAFRVEGSVDGDYITMSEFTWTPILLGAYAVYNPGLAYLPNSGRFVAPYKGIYHFDLNLAWEGSGPSVAARIRRQRTGTVVTTLVESRNRWLNITNTTDNAYAGNNTVINCDLTLNKGDEIWIETYRQSGNNASFPAIIGTATSTWFNGRLVIRLE